jgi:hypothetical protein
MAVERPAAFASTRTIRLDEVSSVIGSTLLRDVEAGTPLLLDDVGSAQPGGAGVSRPRLGVRPSPGVRGGRRGARMKGLSRELRCV